MHLPGPRPAPLVAAALAAMLATLALAHTPARAEYWVDDTDRLLAGATRIEILRVSAYSAKDGKLTGVIVDSIRGRPAGETVTIDWFARSTAPASGAEVLAICDRSLCPRAIGVDAGGYFLLHAREMMDGAQVVPGLVERASLRALAAGTTAAPLCVRATVMLPGDAPLPRAGARAPAPAPAFTGSFSPKNGEGTARGPLLGATPRVAHFIISGGLGGADEDDAVIIKVRGTGPELAFIGGPLKRFDDGCYGAPVMPAHPLALTAAAVKRVLSGAKVETILGRGTITIGTGAHRPGTDPLEIAVDGEGTLRFRSPRFPTDSVALTDTSLPAKIRLGFPESAHGFYPLLLVEVDRRPLLPGVGTPARIAAALADGLEHRWTVYWQGVAPEGATRYVKVGYVTVRGLPPSR